MRSIKIDYLAISCAWMLISLPLAVLASDASDYFQQGIAAFKNDNYQQALEAFDRSQQAGLNTTALIYNFGVSYYRLGRYADAEMAFKKLFDRPKMTALAFYNLGLVALKLNKTVEAKDWFGQALAETDDPKLQILSRKALKGLGVQPKSTRMTKKQNKWRGLVSFAVSDDSNVNLDNEDTFVDGYAQKDTVLGVLVKAYKIIDGSYNDGVRFGVIGWSIKNQTYSEHDYDSIHVSFGKQLKTNDWYTNTNILMQENHFGGSPYSRMFGVEARGSRKTGKTSRIRLRYYYVKRNSLDRLYDYLDGDRHYFRTRFYLGQKKYRWRLEYKYQYDNAEDYRTPTLFRSYSVQRHTFRVTKYFPLVGGLSGRIDLRYRNSKYDDNDVLKYKNDVTSYLREEDRYQAGMRFIYKLYKDWDIYLDYKYTDNQSNRLLYDPNNKVETNTYKRTQISLGAKWKF